MRIKKFLGLSTLTRADLQLLLDVTAEMKKIVLSKNKRAPHLIGKTVVGLFERGTGADLVWATACKYLGGNYFTGTPDDLFACAAIGADAVLLGGSAAEVAEYAEAAKPIAINVGTEAEDPVGALGVLATLRETFDAFSGLKVALCGDPGHSGTANSLCCALLQYGCDVRALAPFLCLPKVSVPRLPREEVASADVVYFCPLSPAGEACVAKEEFAEFFLPQAEKPIVSFGNVGGEKDKTEQAYTNTVAAAMAVLYLATR